MGVGAMNDRDAPDIEHYPHDRSRDGWSSKVNPVALPYRPNELSGSSSNKFFRSQTI